MIVGLIQTLDRHNSHNSHNSHMCHSDRGETGVFHSQRGGGVVMILCKTPVTTLLILVMYRHNSHTQNSDLYPLQKGL